MDPRTLRACATPSEVGRTGDPRPAVFLDRDGTLIVDKPYNANPDEIVVFPETANALRILHAAGYLLFVVTNQSGVARGYYDEGAIVAMHARLDELLVRDQSPIQAYYYCPHHVAGRVPDLSKPCVCRKPEPGMLVRAAKDWSLDLRRSWMIGDRETDRQAGRAAGCQSILVGSGGVGAGAPPVANLRQAAQIIIERDAHEGRCAA